MNIYVRNRQASYLLDGLYINIEPKGHGPEAVTGSYKSTA